MSGKATCRHHGKLATPVWCMTGLPVNSVFGLILTRCLQVMRHLRLVGCGYDLGN